MKRSKKTILILLLSGIASVLVGNSIIQKNKIVAKSVEKYTPTEEQMSLLQGNEIKLPFVGNILMEANQEEAEVCFFNPESNTHYLTFKLYINNEPVYESKEVKPGYAIKHIILNQSFIAGQYEGLIEVKSYDIKTGKMSYGQKQRISVDVIEEEEGTDEDNKK